MTYKRVTERVRIFVLILIIVTATFLILPQWSLELLWLLIIWVSLVILIIIYKFSLYRVAYKNLTRIIKKSGGTMKKGSFIFGVPHSIEFPYEGKTCKIGYSTDAKLDCMLQYIFPLDKAIELRISRKNSDFKSKTGDRYKPLLKKLNITGEDKELVNSWSNNEEILQIISELMRYFRHLFFGKDSTVRLLVEYDVYLTKPKRALFVCKKVIQLLSSIDG